MFVYMVIGIANKHNKTPAQVRSCNDMMPSKFCSQMKSVFCLLEPIWYS